MSDPQPPDDIKTLVAELLAEAQKVDPLGIDDGILLRRAADVLERQVPAWQSVETALPAMNQIVLVRYPSGYDGKDCYNWGARIDGGEGWCWGVKEGCGGYLRPSETAEWNQIEVEDDHQVSHWMPLPASPTTPSEGGAK